ARVRTVEDLPFVVRRHDSPTVAKNRPRHPTLARGTPQENGGGEGRLIPSSLPDGGCGGNVTGASDPERRAVETAPRRLKPRNPPAQVRSPVRRCLHGWAAEPTCADPLGYVPCCVCP